MAWNLNHSISELSTYMYMYKLLNERNIERVTASEIYQTVFQINMTVMFMIICLKGNLQKQLQDINKIVNITKNGEPSISPLEIKGINILLNIFTNLFRQLKICKCFGVVDLD